MSNIKLVYICDEKYVMPTCVSIQSVYEHKKSSQYDIYVIGVDLSKESIDKINSIKLSGIKVKLLIFENKYKSIDMHHFYVSKVALFKFDIPNILSNEDKVLYIDSDIIVMDDLAELFNTDINDYYAGVVRDFPAYYSYHYNNEIDLDDYFNSGVLLLNLRLLRQKNVYEKLLAYKQEDNLKRFMDQDCYNVVFNGQTIALPAKYNYMNSAIELYKKYLAEPVKPVIVHLTTERKPWLYCDVPFSNVWYSCFKKSVCKRDKLDRKFIYREKIDNKRIIHIGNLKISYKKRPSGGGQRRRKFCNFKTYNDLNFDIKNNLYKIPNDIDLIVGIPRSGMLPAYMLGFMKNTQVISINEFIEGNIVKVGKRPLKTTGKNILVVDDTCCSGRAMREAKALLANLEKDYNIKYMCVYSTKEGAKNVDISLLNLDLPRMFSWNYLNHINIENSCFDIDGVLCVDPTEEQNDDGEKYIEFLKNAQPLYIPKYKIKALVTSRLEKYRVYTEQWLQKHNIEYEKLYMLDLPSKEARIKANAHADYKSKIYRKLKDTLYFYESDRGQAQEIFEKTGKTVFCVTTDEVFQK